MSVRHSLLNPQENQIIGKPTKIYDSHILFLLTIGNVFELSKYKSFFFPSSPIPVFLVSFVLDLISVIEGLGLLVGSTATIWCPTLQIDSLESHTISLMGRIQ